MHLTKRQQQVMRRLLRDSTDVESFGNSVVGLPTCDDGVDNTTPAYIDAYGSLFTSTVTMHSLFDMELVADFLDFSRKVTGTLCYALTSKGRMVAAALTRGAVVGVAL